MTDFNDLEPGDRIRLLRVPQADLDQREREIREGCEEAGCTADTIEMVLKQDPIVTITHVEEGGFPWFEYVLETESDGPEEHSIAIMESESWERVT